MTRWHIGLRRRSWLLGPVAVTAFVAMIMAVIGSAAALPPPVPGSAGTDTSLPATASARTVNGRGDFADLAITVNQTEGLVNQAISVTWTGARPSIVAGGTNVAGNFLQIMQCWGDDDGTVPDNPGPPPEQCVQGAQSDAGHPSGAMVPGGFATTRVISRKDWANYDASVGYTETKVPVGAPPKVWRPFRAVDGSMVNGQTDPFFNGNVGGTFWLNTKFNRASSNEIYGARTGPNGGGAELFEVLTAEELAALGCGRQAQPVDGGAKKIPRCWLVIVPRGTAAVENAGTPFEDPTVGTVSTSPLAPAAWQNRIAIPLDFEPLDSSCALGGSERRVAGSEMAARAVGNWLPALCSIDGMPPFAFARTPDGQARQQIAKPSTSASGAVVVSRPVTGEPNPKDPIIYSPLTLGGLVIAFTVERQPGIEAPPDEQLLAGVRVDELNLTPRLVAKLLTQSYGSQIPGNDAPYPWLKTNPLDLHEDPDFLQFNPEFQLLTNGGKNFGGFVLPTGNSDAARQLWQWVLADPEAKAWLAGEPDEFGMVVNPAFSTDAADNTFGVAFGDPIPESFPKNEPHCAPAPVLNNGLKANGLCGGDLMPSTNSFSDAARVARSANPGAKVVLDPFAPTVDKAWKAEDPQAPGQRTILSVTDAASAAKYGLQTARLSRAGDDGADREFIAANAAGFLAGASVMAPGENPAVLEPRPEIFQPGAYPLTTLTYLAIAPLRLSQEARDDYAEFLAYGAYGLGQKPGLGAGRLPEGYAPLPADLQLQAAATAKEIREMPKPPDDPLPTTTASPPPTEPPTTSSTAAPTTTSSTTTTTTTATTTPNRATTTTTRSTTTTSTTSTTTTVAPAETEPTTSTTAVPPGDEPDEPESAGFTPATPILAMSRSRYAVPGLGAVALSSGLGALEITKRPRRRRGPGLLQRPPALHSGPEG